MQHSWEQCGLAEEEVAGLRESLMALHRQLKESQPPHKARLSFAATPSRTRFPLATSLSFAATPSKAAGLPFATPSKAKLSPVAEKSLLESHSEVE